MRAVACITRASAGEHVPREALGVERLERVSRRFELIGKAAKLENVRLETIINELPLMQNLPEGVERARSGQQRE